MDRRNVATQEDAIKLTADFDRITKTIIRFLQMFLNDTLAKRIVSMILIVTGIKDDRVAAAVGLSERSIWALRKTMVSGNIDGLFDVGSGSGRPSKARDIEIAIAEELEKNNYHTRQQVADMILEKFGIVMSVATVGRLLKKTVSED
jgi:transposase